MASRVTAQIPQQFCTYASLKTSSPHYRRKEAIEGSILDSWPLKPLEDFPINDTPDNTLCDTKKSLTSAKKSLASVGCSSDSDSVLREVSTKAFALI